MLSEVISAWPGKARVNSQASVSTHFWISATMQKPILKLKQSKPMGQRWNYLPGIQWTNITVCALCRSHLQLFFLCLRQNLCIMSDLLFWRKKEMSLEEKMESGRKNEPESGRPMSEKWPVCGLISISSTVTASRPAEAWETAPLCQHCRKNKQINMHLQNEALHFISSFQGHGSTHI